MAKSTTSNSGIVAAILRTPLQTLTIRVMYFVMLLLFLIIGYLLGNVFPVQLNTNTQPTTPEAAAPQGQTAPAITIKQVKDAFDKSVIKFGKSNAKNVVIEAADPSCPFCNVAAGKNPDLVKQMGPQFTPVSDGGSYIAPVPELKKLLDDGKISYSYIYYPGHGSGEMGMKAFFCAFDNGKFWEVHDLLMSNEGYNLMNNTVKNDKTQSQAIADFLSPAINSGTMKACLDSGKYDTKIAEETALATGLGVGGTPTYFINEKQTVGAQSFDKLKALIK